MSQPFVMKLTPGGKWSAVIGKGKQIVITALEDHANVSMLLYNAHDYAERYNMPDTLKAQHTAFLTKGNILMSDQGRVLASIIADEVGWHDTISGYTTRQSTDRKYGESNYQMLRNEWLRSGEENFKVELFRNGLSPRDLKPCANLFSKVIVELDGTMKQVTQPTKGKRVTLRTEMDSLFVFSNTPNPFDTSTSYPAAEVQITITDAEPVPLDDICITHCEQNKRAFENTWSAELLRKGVGYDA